MPEHRASTREAREERAIRWLLQQRLWIVLVSLLLGVVAIPRTVLTYASLRSDLEELLPEEAPSVRALDELRARLPGMRYLGVVVDTGGPQNVPHALRFIDDLAARVERYPKDLADGVRTGIEEERAFVETFALQLMDLEDVRELRRSVERRRDWEVTHALDLNLLDEEEDPPPEIPFRKLQEKYEARYASGGSSSLFPDGRFVDAEGRTAVLLIHSSSTSTGAGPDRQLIGRVRDDIADLGFPDAYAPGMRLGLAGDVAARMEEMSGLQVDLTHSSLIVMILVTALLWWFFGSLWSFPVLGVPLLLGISYAFAVVALPPLSIRALNSNTAFLGAIVVGNGINTGIMLLARVQEERRLGASVDEGVRRGLAATWRPTLAAACAAAAAYGSLIFTAFRGFNQFGWIGGFGLLTCWIISMTLTPVLFLAWGHRIPIPTQRLGRGHGRAFLKGLAARPWTVLAVTALGCAGSALAIAGRSGTWMEYDFSKLRRSDSWISGERYWGPRMNQTLGRYLTPTVVLTEDAEIADIVRQRVEALKEQGKAGGLIDSVRTARDLLRPDRVETAREAAKIAELLTPRMLAELKPEDREVVQKAVSVVARTPLTPEQVPETLATGLRELDGRIDRNVLIFPKLDAGTWESKLMAEFTNDLREAATVAGRPQAVAGSLLIASDITEAMRRDGPRATVVALLAVLAVCAFAFRVPARDAPAPAEDDSRLHTAAEERIARLRRPVWLSISAVTSIFLGVLLMMGLVAWSGERINFTNFVALPMTFGIGADYAINMLRRWQSEDSRDMTNALASTGGAVTMCSVTTIAGFGSLLVAQNRMLFSFGVMVVAGMVACLVTSTLVLPAVLRLLGQDRSAGAASLRAR